MVVSTIWSAIGEVATPLAVALAAYAGASLSIWWKARKHKKPQPSLEVMTRADLEITLVLDRILHRFGAQRAYLSQCHDGDAYLGGSEIIKKSRTHERVRAGQSYQQEMFRGVLISSLPEEMKLILSEGPSWTLVDLLPPSKFRWLCECAGVAAVARCAIRRDGRTVAFVGVDFDVPAKPDGIESLCSDAERIGHLMARTQ